MFGGGGFNKYKDDGFSALKPAADASPKSVEKAAPEDAAVPKEEKPEKKEDLKVDVDVPANDEVKEAIRKDETKKEAPKKEEPKEEPKKEEPDEKPLEKTPSAPVAVAATASAEDAKPKTSTEPKSYVEENSLFLVENAKKEGVITLPSGVQYRVQN